MSSTISILHSLARSGGTLISKCLGCIPGNILLSEVHPRGSHYSPLIQARDWFGLITEDEYEEFLQKNQHNYLKAIQLISGRCNERGFNLIIRDWTHIDFTPGPYPVQPVYRLSQYDYLKDHFNIRHMALVRDPVDTYLSLSRLPEYRGKLSFSDYLKGYSLFANIAMETGFVRYEDFCDNPRHSLRHICNTLEVNYTDDFLNHYLSYATITGDIYAPNQQYTLTGDPIGARATQEIRKAPRRAEYSQLESQLRNNHYYKKILSDLGYVT